MKEDEFQQALLYLRYSHIVNHHFQGDRDVIRDNSEFSIDEDAIQLIQQYRHDKASRWVGIATLIVSIITLVITAAPFLKHFMQGLIFSN